MDIQLPLMDGYEATRRIKSNPEMKAVPIIAVTSYALAGDDAKALAAGCNCLRQRSRTVRARCSQRCANIWRNRERTGPNLRQA